MTESVDRSDVAVSIVDVGYRYATRVALDRVSLQVPRQSIVALVGPNGSGKSTLFRLVATLVPLQRGRICCLGFDVASDVYRIRRQLGVVFQSPGLDRQLTVWENLYQHGALYGLSASQVRRHAGRWLERLGVGDRAHELVGRLSGGLLRRAELAKVMLPGPAVLVLDEPSTGLDPKGRADLWEALEELRRAGTTVFLTTHLLEEAERADRVAILDQGRVVAEGSPMELRSECGQEVITIQADDSLGLSGLITTRFGLQVRVVGGQVRVELSDGARWMGELLGTFREQIRSIHLGTPTLEDVFLARTGHRFE